MKKTIILLFKADIFDLPPLFSIIDSLIESYHLVLITQLFNGNKEKLDEIYKDKNLDIISFCPLNKSHKINERIKNRVKRLFFKYKVEKFLNSCNYDILWVIHEDSIIIFKQLLKNKRLIISMYELNDKRIKILKKIKHIVQNATLVTIPEYNRANILRVWLNLKTTPTVIPNKPLYHPLVRYIDCNFKNELRNKKIILYQGLILRERNLNALCEAVSTLQDYTLIIMGNGYGAEEYKLQLKNRYPFVHFIDFINPPNHLSITSYAHIGIVTYDYSSLNTIYCAPNKMWEYAGFGIPMIANEIPGLVYSIGKYNAGICLNMDNSEIIKKAILQISANYEVYSANAKSFYNSFDVKQSINKIVDIAQNKVTKM